MNEAAIILLLERMSEREARDLMDGLEASPRARQAFERIASTRFARALLTKGLCRRSIAYQVAGRYQVALRTAYRRIEAALSIVPL